MKSKVQQLVQQLITHFYQWHSIFFFFEGLQKFCFWHIFIMYLLQLLLINPHLPTRCVLTQILDMFYH